MATRIRDIPKELSKLTMIMNRGDDTPHDESAEHFANLGSLNGAQMFVGSFQGHSPWERHPMGEELVQIVEGETEFTLMTEDGPETLTLTKGQLTVVPQGLWHRFDSATGVTVLTATPQPTDHTFAADPREAG